MLNLLRFRESADCMDPPELAPPEPITGAEAYDRYVRPGGEARPPTLAATPGPPVAAVAGATTSSGEPPQCIDSDSDGFCDYVHDHVAMAEAATAAPAPPAAVAAATVVSPPPLSAAELRYPVWVHLLGGSLAGVTSWSLALPADVVKSNVQGSALETPRAQLRFMTVAARLYKAHGARVFFRGLAPCLLRAIPVNALTFLVYDAVLRRMREARAAVAARLA